MISFEGTQWTKCRPTLVLAAVVILAQLASAGGDEPVDFNRDIRPILSNHCFACHGPDANKRKAELRLDARDVAVQKKAIVPGDIQASLLIQRIVHTDPDERMPPAETKKPLDDRQIDLLQRWVASGAEYSRHWAWIPPVRPDLPHVEEQRWAVNSIDAFILARLEKEDLPPSPRANPHTLMRRLSFDLTGLPPTRGEVAAFLADPSPRAYENLVERLLGSSQFGERMAQHWLDLARYADSDGYHDDTTRAMWPYRDYVITSFNENKPFDVFTREQIAGDQIPDATLEQKVGSAFHRNGPTSSEGGANPEEYRVKYAVDRVNTTATVWLGVTLQCTECHDHKFDPFTQREFYQLFAFFDQVPGNHLFRGLYAPPSIPVPNAQQLAKLHEWDELIAKLEKSTSENPGDEGISKQITDAKKSRDALAKSVPKLRIMTDSPERQPTHLLTRGDFRRKGDTVQPGVPALLPDLPSAATPRLALAGWLNDPKNPLPARVVVNRFWAMLFGNGIVATAEDFGSQGDWPSHPELLDWLAVEFVESGWDIKHMLTLMVTSATYRQSSTGSEHLANIDPANRLFARGPRVRLPAEMIRDNALAVSGLLHEKPGGPSVKPYQPAGLWKEMSYGDSAGKAYKQDHGENLYRRGLYTFWKRSVLYPSFAAFDAPIREDCSVSRPRTNTPLQAFVTLNDVAFVEAARTFAERILREGGTDTKSRIRFAMEVALARPPSASEHSILETLLKDMTKRYRGDTDAAQKIIAAGEQPVATDLNPSALAAWTSVAQAILNLDEWLTKE
jgi:hypothetical protein